MHATLQKPKSQPASVLVVDDDQYVRASIVAFLEETGYLVYEAEHGEHAIQLFHRHKPTLLIVDLKMPVMDGLTLLRTVREQDTDTPVIMVSGAGDVDEVITALKFGANDFLTKPIFDLEDLETSVNQCLAHALMLQENRRYREHLESEVHAKTTSLMAQLTERRKVDLALRRSELRFQSVIENATDIIMTLSPDGQILSINTVFEKLTNWDTGEWLSQPLAELMHPSDREEIRRQLEQAYAGLETSETECRMRNKKGEYIIGELIASALNEQGEVVGILAVIRDITERKQAEYDKQQLQVQLVQAQKLESIGRLAGGVAHDFNNALTAILGFSELALSELPMHHPVREYVDVIKDAGEKAATLTRQLLAFGRKQILRIEPVCLNTVVLRMGRMLQRLIGDHISLRIDAKAPFGTVLADPAQLEQIIMNLVINARDAMPKGGELWIETDNRMLTEADVKQENVKPGLFVEIIVRDTGIGIEAHDMPQIFEPFYTTKEPGKGTGLGLATVFGVLSQHKGFITANSRPKNGATFTAYLPAVIKEVDEVQQVKPKTSQLVGGNEAILVVDDEAAIRRLLQSVLSKLGYRIYMADCGQRALEIAEDNQVDLLLSDMMMPGMNGAQLAQHMQELHPNSKTIIMSGYVQQDHNTASVSEVSDCYIEKPIKPYDIAQTIRKVLDNKEAFVVA